MIHSTRAASEAHRKPPEASRPRGRSTQPSGTGNGMLPAVIAACFLPVVLLAIAVHGGGVVTVALAFVAEALITAALVLLLGRAMGGPPDGTQ